jgi:hypothetical protein
VVSTYSLVYTLGSGAYIGGVLAPNGDIHFIPYQSGTQGQKVSASGVVSTYSVANLIFSYFAGGILAANGEIHFVPVSGSVGQFLMTGSAMPFDIGVCASPHFNKF